ncbi:MAG: RNA-binding cell elongation regulator Jag/EloR [Anaerococcus sp.]|nr:RNA-binding cell elongation regulator Jag/EloR [Anaerococcus sp.]
MKKSIIKTAKTKDQAIKLALEEIGKSKDEVTIEVLEEESQGFFGLIGSKDAVVRVSYEEDIKQALEDLENEVRNTPSFTSDSLDEKIDQEPIRQDKAKKEPREEVVKEAEPLDDKPIDKPVDDKKQAIKDKQRSDIDKYYEAKEFFENILKAMHFDNVSVIGNLEDNIIKLEAKVDENDTGIAIGKGGSTLEAIELIIRKAIDSRRSRLRVNIDINSYKKRRDEKIVDLARDTARKVYKSKKSWNLRYMNSYERRLAHEEIAKHKNVTSHSEGMEPRRYVVVDYVED